MRIDSPSSQTGFPAGIASANVDQWGSDVRAGPGPTPSAPADYCFLAQVIPPHFVGSDGGSPGRTTSPRGRRSPRPSSQASPRQPGLSDATRAWRLSTTRRRPVGVLSSAMSSSRSADSSLGRMRNRRGRSSPPRHENSSRRGMRTGSQRGRGLGGREFRHGDSGGCLSGHDSGTGLLYRGR